MIDIVEKLDMFRYIQIKTKYEMATKMPRENDAELVIRYIQGSGQYIQEHD